MKVSNTSTNRDRLIEDVVDRVARYLADDIMKTINRHVLRIQVLYELRKLLAKIIAEKIADDIAERIVFEGEDKLVVKITPGFIDIDAEKLKEEVYEEVRREFKEELIEKLREVL